MKLFLAGESEATPADVAVWAGERNFELVRKDLISTYRAITDSALRAAVQAQLMESGEEK